jgi:hypothetical protein
MYYSDALLNSFFPMGTVALSLGIKRRRRETDHSSPSSTEARIGGSITPHPTRLHGMVFNKCSTGIIYLLNLTLLDYIHGPIVRNDVSETTLSPSSYKKLLNLHVRCQ